MSGRPLTICAIGHAGSPHIAARTRCFAERGHRVFLVTEVPSPAGIEGVTELVPGSSPAVEEGLRRRLWLRLGRCAGVDPDEVLRTLAFVDLLRRCRPDIVHVHYAYSHYGWLAGTIGCRPLAVTVMGGDVLFAEQGSPTPEGKWLTLQLLRRADYITAKSDHLTAVLDDLGGFGAKTERIVWGVSLRGFRRLDTSALRARLGLARDRRVVLSPRGLQRFYRIHLLVEAMALVARAVPEAMLLVTEYGADPAYRAELEAKVREHGLQRHVQFCGSVDHAAMPAYYSLAEIAVSLPPSDGLPQTLLESLACETPIILCRLPRYEELVTHGSTAYFVDAEPAAIAAGIVELLTRPGLRAAIARAGRALVSERADFDEQTDRVERRFQELAKRPARAWSPWRLWQAWRSSPFRGERESSGSMTRATGDRVRVVMLCAHEPTLDPRIRWEAEGAAGRFDVTVVGFNREDRSLPPVERRDGYEIRRLPRVDGSTVDYGRRLFGVLDGRARLAVLPPGIGALAAGAFLKLARGAARRLPDSRIVTPARAALRGAALRSRLAYVRAVLRGEFAPATALFWKFLDETERPLDVVHCNDLDTLLAGVLAKRRLGCRLVYDAHEYFPHSDPEGGWIDRRVFHWIEQHLVRSADAVVTVNHRLAEVMGRAYGLRVLAVPNAEPWSEAGPRPAVSTMSSLARTRVKFLFQGRFTPGRGVEELITAWTEVDPSRVALFLRGPDSASRRRLVELAGRLRVLGRSVYFPDAVTEDALVSAAAEADVGIIPYKGEVAGYRYACPNKLSQYLHAGLMVLTNVDLLYVREVVEAAGAGLTYSLAEPGSLTAAVSRIAREPELLLRSRDNALRYARETFNWQAFSETLYAQYGEGGGPRP